ncbi:MAG TPA: 3-hydroxyacyl-CoA dehydrogenase/enoyl-CoA hydratase family protein [Alphaproteobacteria bacterium]
MTKPIQKVAVIGAGVMGAAIAAHMANAGIPVHLLDIVKDPEDRNKVAREAVEKMLKTSPAPFMHPKNAKLVTVGNIEDDLSVLKDVDWVIEAIIERLDIKHDLYAKITKNRGADTIISSNTSTIPLHKLIEGQDKDFQSHFLITHFFNPPRYMRLLEIVTGDKTKSGIADRVGQFGDVVLGKGVVHCKDTAGFIANRLGVFWMTTAINAAFDQKITVEEADALLSKPIGVPKTGVFGLVDLVGLDLMPHLSKSLLDNLPKDDAYRSAYRDIPLINKLIADGYTGRKGKGGFYRLNTDGGKKQKEALDLQSGDYKPEKKAELAAGDAGRKGLRAVLTHPDKYGEYVHSVMIPSLHYAASLVPQIADDIISVDSAMQMGFNWKFGPFEMIDQLGVDWFIEQCEKLSLPIHDLLQKAKGQSFYKTENGVLHFFGTDGKHHPVKRAEGVLLLSDIKRAGTPVAKNGSASIWDIGDGVLCVEFHSKMNAIDTDIFAQLQKATQLIGDGKGNYKALVIHNEADNFSVGANIGLALFALNVGLFGQIEELVEAGQKTYSMLQYAPFPVVAAPAGMALGGGCEVLLHADVVMAHAELYMGLVEVGVGLIPGWGGCTELLFRHKAKAGPKSGPMVAPIKAFETISVAKTSTSAAEAFDLLYLRDGVDRVVMNKDRLLFDAKQKALELAKDYAPPVKDRTIALPGPSGKAAMMLAVGDFQKKGAATLYDGVVSEALADVLSGGKDADATVPVDEDFVLKQERTSFNKLVRNEGTLNRIQHMLDNGKPLRN